MKIESCFYTEFCQVVWNMWNNIRICSLSVNLILISLFKKTNFFTYFRISNIRIFYSGWPLNREWCLVVENFINIILCDIIWIHLLPVWALFWQTSEAKKSIALNPSHQFIEIQTYLSKSSNSLKVLVWYCIKSSGIK